MPRVRLRDTESCRSVLMKIAVVGAGALGSLVGGLLARKDENVTLIGRSDHVEVIQREGLRLSGTLGDHVVRLKAQEEMTEKPDLTIFATKTQDLEKACGCVSSLVGRGPAITMQNGIRCDEIACRYFAPWQVVGCVVFCAVSFLEPGRVECQVRGWLSIGDPFVPDSSRLRWIRQLLQRALPVHISHDIQAARWAKLIGNLNNALPAITGLSLQEIYASESTSRLALRLMKEGLGTLSAAGIRLYVSPVSGAMRLGENLPDPLLTALFRALAGTRLGEIPMFGSTWQSVMRGSSTEIDYLNGEIVALGNRIGHPTPYNAHVVNLVREVERSGEFRPVRELWPE